MKGKINTKILALIFVIMCVIVGILGLLLLKNSEGVVKEDASVSEKLIYNVTAPDPLNLKKGKIREVRILFSNQSSKGYVPVSTVGFKLTYTGPGTIVNKEGKSSGIVYAGDLIDAVHGWDIPVNSVIKDKDIYMIEFAGANVDTYGYESKDFTHLASIFIELENAEDTISPLQLVIDPNVAFVMTKADNPKNIYNGESNLRLQIVE